LYTFGFRKRLIMKKSSILFAALFAFALIATSCGGGQQETETENTETMESTDDNMETESMEEETMEMEADTAAMEMEEEHPEGDGHEHPSDGGSEHPN